MTNRDIDELLFNLRKRMNKGLENKELSFFLSNDSVSDIINLEFSIDSDCIVNQLRKKIVTDFYAYYLYKQELDEDIDEKISKILLDFKEFSTDEDLINYIKNNLDKFNVMIDGYFEYHEQSIEYQCEVLANVVNKRKGLEFTSLYKDFFMVDFDYEYLLLQHNAIIGLELLEFYNKTLDDSKIISYLNTEFEEKIDKYNFLNYILSNVYVNLKLNGCKNKEDENIVNLTEKLDKKMRCFYNDNNYIIKLVKKYNNLYGNVKWYDFKDIRNYFPFDNIDLIYKLDNNYKHPQDILKNASKVFTIMGNVQEFLINSIEGLVDLDKSDDQIEEWLFKLVDGEIALSFSNNDIFSFEDENLVYNLIKLFMTTSYYEYCNYNIDSLTSEQLSLYKFIDNGIDNDDCLEIFNDEEDKYFIIDTFYQYTFCKECTELRARKKIVDDNKFFNILKFNPFMYLEYRRAFGSLLPLETSKSTEYGNIIMETLFDILSLSDNLEDEFGIKYSDLSQMFKNEYLNINMDIDEIVGFIISNIYENLINKKNLNNDELDFIKCIEDNNFCIDNIINNDELLGQILFYFFNLNSEFFNDEKLKKLRSNYNSQKIKILKRFDPFYDVDYEILK